MRSALEEGIIKKNPCKKIKIQRSESEEQRVLTRDEQEAVKNAASDVADLPTLLSLYTGIATHLCITTKDR